MRHRNAGYKLGRNTSHRRAMLRNLVTSIILEDRVQTTVAKAKAARPHVEKLITLGKKGDLHSRRQALAFLQTGEAVTRLFDTVAPRYGDRNGGYLRIIRAGFQRGDGAERCRRPWPRKKAAARAAKRRLRKRPKASQGPR